MSNIRIIRASAGSGKTNSLIKFFLELLIAEPTDYFKHILAVTFTNKATAEMKVRILEELDRLATGKSSKQLGYLMEISKFKEEHIRNKASVILQNILHGYSWFSVETIDTFFQRIIRAFTRELNIPGNYAIEIETGPILQYAVDALVDSLHDNSSLLTWLMDFSEERIDEGRPWDFRSDLLKLGSEVFKEEFSYESDRIFQAVSDRKKLNDFRDSLYKIISSTETLLAGYADTGTSLISDHGLEDTDFFQKGRGVLAYFRKLQSRSPELPNSYVLRLLDGEENWPAKDSPNKVLVIQLAKEKLLPLLNEIMAVFNTHYRYYETAKTILKNLHTLGILSDLSEKIAQYRHQRNKFLLSDSPGFINKIIDDNVAPFIYEKMGNRYNHFLIDEFQDTSQMQWKNLLPLVENSISQGNDCLLVGDVKQSIYRWRNSNWEILAEEIHKDFQNQYIRLQDLNVNWRSCRTIVEFTNSVFPAAIDLLEKYIEDRNIEFLNSNPELRKMISRIYKGVEQSVAGQNVLTGYVKLEFFSKQEVREDDTMLLDTFFRDIKNLLELGYSPGDIAILVRGKREGKQIADFLIQKNSEKQFALNLNVISDESLFLSSSDSVNLLIAGLRFLIKPEDDINRGGLVTGFEIHRLNSSEETGIYDVKMTLGMSNEHDVVDLLPGEFVKNIDSLLILPLYELVERLISIFRADVFAEDVAYIHALLDLVHEYSQSNPADIEKFLEYWEEEGSTKSVSAAESQNAIRILTIHKAKGLEFKAVLVPYCNWDLEQKSNTLLWTKPQQETFNYLPLIPINYTSALAGTFFSEVYYREMLKSYIDNLNLLYVAFTRAKEVLIVYPHYKVSKTGNMNFTSVGDLIYTLAEEKKIVGPEKYCDEENGKIEFGKLVKPPASSSDSREVFISPSPGKPAIEKLFFNPSGFDFLSETYQDIEEKRRKGKILHNILSEITTSDDISGAVTRAIYKGFISQEESREFIDHLDESLRDNTIRKWFDGSGKIVNETDIVLPGGEVRRPDRVVLFTDSVDVIDYKSGSEEQYQIHRKQVNNYMNLLQNMGYHNVNGYLWYIASNKIVKV